MYVSGTTCGQHIHGSQIRYLVFLMCLSMTTIYPNGAELSQRLKVRQLWQKPVYLFSMDQGNKHFISGGWLDRRVRGIFDAKIHRKANLDAPQWNWVSS